MEDNIRHVVFKERQSGEDLYYCHANRKVYCRQPSNTSDLAFWYTTVKWSGGYEADCHIKEGITFIAKIGNQEFAETLENDDWNSGTSAKKTGPFSWEIGL